MRGGTAYWAGSFPTTANPAGSLLRTDARHVQKGVFNQKVYRITNAANRAAGKTGVFIYCEQHAREWVGGITCLETAQRLITQLRDGPDHQGVCRQPRHLHPAGREPGRHARVVLRQRGPAPQPDELLRVHQHERLRREPQLLGRRPQPQQRDRLALRRLLGRELLVHERHASPARPRSPSRRSRTSTGSSDTFPKIKFAMNLHTHGGYFMWAPGAYKAAGRVTLPAPNIGIERYFFEVADDVLVAHPGPRATRTILPQRTGPIADVLYSAAGNSADDMYYRKGIIGYSFEAGAQRITVNRRRARSAAPRSASSRASARSAPAAAPAPCNASLVNEGHDEAMEFAEGNLGLIKGALRLRATTPRRRRRRSSSPPRRRAAIRSTTSSIGSARARSSSTRRTGPTRSSCRTIPPRRWWTSGARTPRRPSATAARARACRARC